MYKCAHFDIRELVYPEIYEKYKDKQHRLWLTLDQDALITIDALQEIYGPTIINNWHWGGVYDESGLRPMGTDTGAGLSQHKFGRGFDLKFKNVSADQVRKDMKKAGAMDPGPRDVLPLHFRYIRRIEELTNKKMTWFHMDTGNHDVVGSGVLVIKVTV